MRRNERTSRRNFLRGAGVAAGSLLLGGCDQLSRAPWFRRILASGEDLTLVVQRALLSPDDLAREYTEADLSPKFRANGSTASEPTASGAFKRRRSSSASRRSASSSRAILAGQMRSASSASNGPLPTRTRRSSVDFRVFRGVNFA